VTIGLGFSKSSGFEGIVSFLLLLSVFMGGKVGRTTDRRVLTIRNRKLQKQPLMAAVSGGKTSSQISRSSRKMSFLRKRVLGFRIGLFGRFPSSNSCLPKSVGLNITSEKLQAKAATTKKLDMTKC